MAVTDLQQLVHDLRNRIAPIRNVIYLMRLRGTNDPKLGEAVAMIERQIDAMTRMLDEVSSTAGSAGSGGGLDPSPSADPDANKDTAKGGDPVGARRILIADDSVAVCESFASILTDLGHEVRSVHDGVEAVDMATAWMPDFVLLDVNMPKLNGYEAARRLRERFPSSPQSPSPVRLVMISGANVDSGVLESARHAGFDHCLDKLLDFSALRKMLEA